MKCLRPDCKGTLIIRYRQNDLKPFIACSNYTHKNPDKLCDFTESLSDSEIELLKSELVSNREIIDMHYHI